jgi:hypothetical protein
VGGRSNGRTTENFSKVMNTFGKSMHWEVLQIPNKVVTQKEGPGCVIVKLLKLIGKESKFKVPRDKKKHELQKINRDSNHWFFTNSMKALENGISAFRCWKKEIQLVPQLPGPVKIAFKN